jgi:hypothetical protein
MKLRISVPQIVCNRTTMETSPDEIYFAYFVAQGRATGDAVSAQFLARRISDVWRNVNRNDRWQAGEPCEIDVADDAAVLAIMFALYEKDDGKIREELKSSREPIPSKEPWLDLELPGTGGWSAWAKVLFKFLVALLRQIPRDDEIGMREVSIDPKDRYALGTRTFDLKGFGGKYTVTLLVERVD